MSTGDVIRCPRCGLQRPYHTAACSGWAPTDSPDRITQPVFLTEADVRRIVREELALHFENQPSSNNP